MGKGNCVNEFQNRMRDYPAHSKALIMKYMKIHETIALFSLHHLHKTRSVT